MNKPTRNLLAVFIAIIPVNAIMIWYRLTQTQTFSTLEIIVYPLVVGGAMSALILWLNKVLVKATFKKTFNPAKEPVSSDVVMGVLMMLVFFLMFWIEKMTIYQWLPQNSPNNPELMNTIEEIAYNPFLMTLWLGPTLWIGVAFFEELSRVFLLKCLWNVNKNKTWQIIVIILSAGLTSAIHLYQGVAGMISIGLMSLLMGFYFYKFKRILPLILYY